MGNTRLYGITKNEQQHFGIPRWVIVCEEIRFSSFQVPPPELQLSTKKQHQNNVSLAT